MRSEFLFERSARIMPLMLMTIASVAFAQSNASGDDTDTPLPKRLHLLRGDLEAVRIVDQAAREVRFERVKPFVLPPLPEALPTVEPAPPGSAPIPPEGETIERRLWFFGAITYTVDGQPDKAVTQLRVWPSGGGKESGFWTDANFLWLSGFVSFEAGGVRYDCLTMVSEAKLGSWRELAEAGAPETLIPGSTAGAAAPRLLSPEHQRDSEAMAGPLRELLKIYERDRLQLRAAHEGRLAAAEARARERQLNPPEEKTLILRHWRTDLPAPEAPPADIR